MDDVLAALTEQHMELNSLVEELSIEDSGRPSACEGWDIADVVLHLAQTEELALASLEGSFADRLAAIGQRLDELDEPAAQTVDGAAALLVRLERGVPWSERRQRWALASERLRTQLSAADPHERVPWLVGDLTARTLAATRLTECWLHTRDIAEGLGVALDTPERVWHIARLVWRSVPYAFARAGLDAPGPIAFHLRGPGGEQWRFDPDDQPVIVVGGEAVEVCLVAGQRVELSNTSLQAKGPRADDVLALMRTYA